MYIYCIIMHIKSTTPPIKDTELIMMEKETLK